MRTTILIIALGACAFAQPTEPLASLLLRLDNEHYLGSKEGLLNQVTAQHADAGPALLQLAQSTGNTDTRWMAMRGMATLHYIGSAPFLEASLKDPDALVRANAARALLDLKIADAAPAMLTMFAGEQDDGALQQASLALEVLRVKAAAPYIRQKLPGFKGQTLGWLIQALGALGDVDDVPSLAGYFDQPSSGFPAAYAIEALAGVSFGPHTTGAFGVPPPGVRAAQAWWKTHKDAWPRCDDCHLK